MTIITRSQWGASYGQGAAVPRRPVRGVVVHHAYRPNLTHGLSEAVVRGHVQTVERHHVITNGWAGIGYNFMIDQDGRIWEGRGWGRAGAHAGDAAINRDSVGICFLIDGQTCDPTEQAWRACEALIREGVRLGELAPDYLVTGHRDHRSTTCPGERVYRQLDRLRGLKVVTPSLSIPAPPPLVLERIEVPRPEHVTEILRVRQFTPEMAAAGLSVAEVLLRGVQRAASGDRAAAVKSVADALADWLKSRHPPAA